MVKENLETARKTIPSGVLLVALSGIVSLLYVIHWLCLRHRDQ